jgi:hypothetical protein
MFAPTRAIQSVAVILWVSCVRPVATRQSPQTEARGRPGAPGGKGVIRPLACGSPGGEHRIRPRIPRRKRQMTNARAANTNRLPR